MEEEELVRYLFNALPKKYMFASGIIRHNYLQSDRKLTVECATTELKVLLSGYERSNQPAESELGHHRLVGNPDIRTTKTTNKIQETAIEDTSVTKVKGLKIQIMKNDLKSLIQPPRIKINYHVTCAAREDIGQESVQRIRRIDKT